MEVGPVSIENRSIGWNEDLKSCRCWKSSMYEYPIVGPVEYGDSCLIPKVRVHHPEINGSWNAVEALSIRWEGLGRDMLSANTMIRHQVPGQIYEKDRIWKFPWVRI